MSLLPEFFVSLGFLPCGLWMGFMIHIIPEHYQYVLVGPQICAMVTAGLAGIILTLTKQIYGRVRFYHMLLIGFGILSLFACGIAFVINYQDPTVGLYFGGLGHGLVYVAGLSYTHFRSKDDGFRVTRTGFCHLVHLGGMTLYVHSTSDIQNTFIIHAKPYDIVFRGGWLILGASFIALCGLVLNEILHLCGMYNYKKCRDSVLEDANDNSDHFKSTLGFNDVGSLTQEPNTGRQFGLSLLSLCLKITNITFNYHMFIYFTFIGTFYLLNYPLPDIVTYIHNYRYILYYFGILGLTVGLIASTFLSYKLIFMKSLGATFLAIIIGTSLMSSGHLGMAGISFWLMYFSLGVGMFCPDIAIMEVSNLRLTELFLAKGYIMENTVTCTILYIFHRHSHRLLLGYGIFWTNGGVFAALFLIILILFIVFFPQTFKKRLITIQYIVLYDLEDKPTVLAKPPPAQRFP